MPEDDATVQPSIRGVSCHAFSEDHARREVREIADRLQAAMSRVVLLFLHGGSHTKECRNPIIKRLQKAPLLQRVACEIAAFDWRFHGEKSDHSVPGTLSFVGGDKARPVADHALHVWTDWGRSDLREEVRKLREKDTDAAKTNIVAIGHSMGASTMIQVEAETPGTFQGIVAFEPVHRDGKPDELDGILNMLVSITAARPAEWNSWDEVVDHFKTGKAYRRWNPESMDAFLEQGVRKTSDGRFVLATAPLQEASIYCHDIARVACPVVIEHASKSVYFNAKKTEKIVSQFPNKVSMGEAIPNTTHSMVVEDPATSADHILQNLARLPLFRASARL